MIQLPNFELAWKAKLSIGDFQISASCSESGRFVLCGSQDLELHSWHLSPKFDKVTHYENWVASSGAVLCTKFAPVGKRKTKIPEGSVLVSGCMSGEVKVWEYRQQM